METDMAVLTILFVLIACGTAQAQGEPPRFSVAGGAGAARQFSTEFDFGTTPMWQVSGRAQTAGHFAIEGVFEQWSQEQGRVINDLLLTGPDGPLGRAARIEQHEHFRMRTIAFNALATARSGRVLFMAGGGGGVMAYDRTFAQETSGCDAPAAAACGRFENGFSSSSATLQAVAGVDVAITRRVAAFGRYDLVLPVRDIGFGHGGVTAGVRLFLW